MMVHGVSASHAYRYLVGCASSDNTVLVIVADGRNITLAGVLSGNGVFDCGG